MIIGISGKLGSGKDLVGKIIQCLTDKPQCFEGMNVITEEDINYKVWDQSKFINKKFADPLKDFICMILGCTREKLEDRNFKEGVLPEEWWYYKLGDGKILPRGHYPNEADNKMCEERYLVKTTPRLLLQLMGTECGRDILHPNIWVNAVMSGYTADHKQEMCSYPSGHNSCLPDWVITDMRFPNEFKAVEERGFTIRVNRNILPTLKDCKKNLVEYLPTFLDGTIKSKSQFDKGVWQNYIYKKGDTPYLERALTGKNIQNGMCGLRLKQSTHESETALDNAEFDYVIENNGTILDLVKKIRRILIKEKFV